MLVDMLAQYLDDRMHHETGVDLLRYAPILSMYAGPFQCGYTTWLACHESGGLETILLINSIFIPAQMKPVLQGLSGSLR